MKIDLKIMTRKQLEKLRADVDVALIRLIERERKAALIAAEKAANAHGFTLAEIAASAKQSKNTTKTKRKPLPRPKQRQNTATLQTSRKPGVAKGANLSGSKGISVWKE